MLHARKSGATSFNQIAKFVAQFFCNVTCVLSCPSMNLAILTPQINMALNSTAQSTRWHWGFHTASTRSRRMQAGQADVCLEFAIATWASISASVLAAAASSRLMSPALSPLRFVATSRASGKHPTTLNNSLWRCRPTRELDATSRPRARMSGERNAGRPSHRIAALPASQPVLRADT